MKLKEILKLRNIKKAKRVTATLLASAMLCNSIPDIGQATAYAWELLADGDLFNDIEEERSVSIALCEEQLLESMASGGVSLDLDLLGTHPQSMVMLYDELNKKMETSTLVAQGMADEELSYFIFIDGTGSGEYIKNVSVLTFGWDDAPDGRTYNISIPYDGEESKTVNQLAAVSKFNYVTAASSGNATPSSPEGTTPGEPGYATSDKPDPATPSGPQISTPGTGEKDSPPGIPDSATPGDGEEKEEEKTFLDMISGIDRAILNELIKNGDIEGIRVSLKEAGYSGVSLTPITDTPYSDGETPKFSLGRNQICWYTADIDLWTDIQKEIIKAAEAFYGTEPNEGTIDIYLTQKSPEGEEIKTGDTVTLEIECDPLTAETFKNYNDYIPKPFFNSYQETTIHLRLPEGMEIISVPQKYEDYTLINGVYIFNIGDMTPGSGIRFDIQVAVSGNGSTPVGTPYKIRPEDAWVETSYQLLDKSEDENGVPIPEALYHSRVESKDAYEFFNVTDDTWAVSKHVINPDNPAVESSGYWYLDTENDEIVITYKLETGLVQNGFLQTEDTAYDDSGRAPLSAFLLTDHLELSMREGSDTNLKPKSVKAWPFTDNIPEGEPIKESNGTDTISFTLDDLNTCESISGVDHGAKKYTAFWIEVRYTAEPFRLEYNDPDVANERIPFTINNKADISYVIDRYDDTEEITETDNTNAVVNPKIVKESASIEIRKYIDDALSGSILYTTSLDADGMYPGYAEFTIMKGTCYDDVWMYTYYDKVSVNPAKTEDEIYEATGGSGTTTITLPSGRYRITETHAPDNTEMKTEPITIDIGEGETKYIDFHNKSKYGQIRFRKKVISYAGEESYEAGIEFGLYTDEEAMIPYLDSVGTAVTAKTDGQGYITFYPVVPGTYYVKEKPNDSYIPNNTIYRVVVYANSTATDLTDVSNPETVITGADTVINKRNVAAILLQKRLVDYVINEETGKIEETYLSIAPELRNEMSFVIQKMDSGIWTDVAEMFLTENSAISATNLPVYNSDGKRIKYRVVEKLPDGYEVRESGTVSYEAADPDNPDDYRKAIVYYGELTPLYTKTETLYNTHKGSLEVTKTEIINEDGEKKERPVSKTFQLWQRNHETGILVPVLQENGKQVTGNSEADGKIKFTDLPIIEENDGVRSYVDYYIEEVDASGYHQESDAGIVEVLIDGDFHTMAGPVHLLASKDATVAIRNVEDKIPFYLNKKDSITGGNIAGAQFKVEKLESINDETGIEIVNPESEGGLWESNNDGYVFLKLDPESFYRITEIVPPTGEFGEKIYMDYDNGYGNKFQLIKTGAEISANTPEISRENAVICRDFAINSGYKAVFEDEPIAKVNINKYLVNDIGSASRYNAEFYVYTENEETGEMVPVLDDSTGTPVVIKANSASRVLVPGIAYYFREKVAEVSDITVINPDILPDSMLWSGSLKIKNVDGTDYYGPYDITGKKNTDTVQLFSLNNYYYGSMTVTKKDRLTGQNVAGAVFQIVSKLPEDHPDYSSATGTTGNNGTIDFRNLKAYTYDGERITYIITELAAPEGYNISYETLETVLIPGKKITHMVSPEAKNTFEEPSDEGALLAIHDEPHFSITIRKVWRDDWNYRFNPVENILENVRIVLFEKVGDELVMISDAYTDDFDGSAVFKELDRTKTYYMIEAAPKDGKYLPEGKENLPEQYLSGEANIPVSKVNNYNYLVYNESGDSPVNGTSTNITSPLVNHKPWAQIHITKNCDQGDGCPDSAQHKSDGAQFILYELMEKPADTIVEIPSSDELADSSKFREVGSYESGTILGDHGERLQGEFYSSILEYGSLYLLVEESPGPGYIIADNQKYTLYYPGEGEEFTLSGGRSVEYQYSKITDDTVQNTHATGGTAMPHYWAQLKLNKWMDGGDGETPDYRPLGDVKYELSLLYPDSSYVEGAETVILETGLNSVDDNLRGDAISASIKLEQYQSLFPEAVINSETNVDGFPEYMEALFELKEVEAPNAILMDEKSYHVTIRAYADKQYSEDNINYEFYCVSATECGIVPGTTRQRTRLVNTPFQNYVAIIRSYGYTVKEETLGKTDQELHAITPDRIGRVPLEGVSIIIERKRPDGTWYRYPDSSTSFSSDGDGKTIIPNGLPKGTYRLQETLTSGQKKEFDTRYTSSRWLYFSVTIDGAEVQVYNPRLPRLVINKTEMDGTTPVDGVTFGITGTSPVRSRVTAVTDADGIAELSLANGSYSIDEAGGNPKVTADYQKDGLFGITSAILGYQFRQDGKFVVTDALYPEEEGSYELVYRSYRDPETFDFIIEKRDHDTNKFLSDAKFRVSYQKFTAADGIYAIGETVPQSGWNVIASGKQTEDGKIKIENASPGWYMVEETDPPAGYSLDNSSIKYYAINTNMEVVFPEEPLGFTCLTAVDGKASCTFRNKAFIPVYLTKSLSTGNTGIELNAEEKKAALEKITFTVYRKEGDSYVPATVYQKNGTEYVKNGASKLERNSNVFSGFIQQTEDNEFFIKETIVNPDSKLSNWYPMNSLEYIPLSLDADTEGALSITAGASDLLGKSVVTIKKVDLDYTEVPVNGAVFEVYKTDPSEEGARPIANVKTVDHRDGTYTLTIPTDREPKNYYIKEIAAPSTYAITKDLIIVEDLQAGDSRHFDETLSGPYNPETWLPGLIIADDRGIDIHLEKYSNIKAMNPGNSERMPAKFMLYYSYDGETTWHAYYDNPKQTNENGYISMPNVPLLDVCSYAIAEEEITSGEYKGYELESVCLNGRDMEKRTITVAGEDIAAYILDVTDPGETRILTYKVYNKPAVKFTVIKRDVDPDIETEIIADFDVYYVSEENGETKEEKVETFRTRKASSADQYASATLQLKPGTYHIVETKVWTSPYAIMAGHKDVIWERYITIPDEGRKVLEDPIVFMDDAMDYNVTPVITKEKEEDSIKSLFTHDGQSVTYTLSTGVKDAEHNTPVKNFLIMDSGLTMKHRITKETEEEQRFTVLDDSYTYEKYTVSSVTLEGPVSYKNLIKGAEGHEPEISAVVSFHTFDKDITDATQDHWLEIHNDTVSEDKVYVSASALREGAVTINAPVTYDAEGNQKKYRGFSVSFVDEGLKELTKIIDEEGNISFDGYALGADFNPGTIKATITIDQQEETIKSLDPSTGESLEMLADSVDEIENKAAAWAEFMRWSNAGLTNETIRCETSSALISVDELNVPIVSVEKTVSPSTTVWLEDTITYSIKIRNESDPKEGRDPLVNPVIIDRFPDGLTLVGYEITENPDGFTKDNCIRKTGTDPRYMMFYLNGSLEAGHEVTLQITAKVDKSVVGYGTVITNYAYVTTKEKGITYKDNAYGATFKDTNYGWLQAKDNELEQAVGEELPGYGYISDEIACQIVQSGSMNLSKLVSGDGDPETWYGSESAAPVTQGGYAKFKLVLNNGSVDTSMVDIRVADLLPYKDDKDLEGDSISKAKSRGSEWSLIFNGLPQHPYISKAGDSEDIKYSLTDSQYKLWVAKAENGDIGNELARQAIASTRVPMDSLAGWEIYNPDDTLEEKSRIRAFLVEITDTNLELKADESMVIQAATLVPEFGESFDNMAFTLAVNNFAVNYYEKSFNGTKVKRPKKTSTNAQAILVPKDVEAGGRVWIDANFDGIQQESEYEFYKDLTIQKAMRSMNIRLIAYTGNTDSEGTGAGQMFKKDSETAVSRGYTGSDGTWDGRFSFSGLSSSVVDSTSQLYSTGGKDPLNPAALKNRKYAVTYRISADLPEQFRVTEKTVQTGEPGRSRMPSELYGGPASAEAYDSNVWYDSKTEQLVTERFFLWPTSGSWDSGVYDYSKDIGIIPYRNISLYKQDQEGRPVADTKFEIYGPFRSESEIELSEATRVYPRADLEITEGMSETEKLEIRAAQEGKTMEDGSLPFIPPLMRYATYVIVETGASAGYMTEGAMANLEPYAVSATDMSSAWILPAKEIITDESEDTIPDTVTVTNLYGKGNVVITKTDADTGKRLAGAEFELSGKAIYGDICFDNSMEEFMEFIEDEKEKPEDESWFKKAGIVLSEPEPGHSNPEVSDNSFCMRFTVIDGYANLKPSGYGFVLPRGSYTLKEIKAPKSYNLSSARTFTIEPETNSKQKISLTVKDQPFHGSAILHKSSEDGTSLQGAVYSLFKEGTTSPIATGLTTGGDGFTSEVTDLKWGDYYFIETKAPEGYSMNTEKERFTIDGDNVEVCQTVYAEDQRVRGTVKLQKYDEPTKSTPLKGAEFSLYTADNVLVSSGHVTDSDGALTVTGLDWGAYYFKENKAPAGYDLAEKIWFAVNSENCKVTQIITCYDEESLATIKINKIVNDNYAPFGDPTFVFEIEGTDIHGVFHKWIRTISMGGETENSTVLTGIPQGNYTITEVSTSRYKLAEIAPVVNAAVSGTQATTDFLGKEQMYAEVTFVNEIEQYEKLSHTVSAINEVSGKPVILTGVTAEFTEPEMSYDAESTYAIKSNDLVVTAFYSDGTSKLIGGGLYSVTPGEIIFSNNADRSGYQFMVTYTENGITKDTTASLRIKKQKTP